MALFMRSHQIIYLQPVHQCKELYHKCKYCKNNAHYWIDLKWLWLFPQPLHSLNGCRCSSMHPFLNFPFHLYHFWLHNSHLFYPYLTNCLFIYCHCPTICQSTPPPSSVSTYHFPGFVLPPPLQLPSLPASPYLTAISLTKDPNLKCHLSMLSRDAAWPAELFKHFVSFFL